MKQGSVILADNHQNTLESIRGLLETSFETVVMVADKSSLYEVAAKLKPDLAVVDLSLPASSEVNVARELRQRYPELKFIILSIHDESTAVEEVMSAGASGFVLKRSTVTDLMSAVDEVLKGQTYVSPSVNMN